MKSASFLLIAATLALVCVALAEPWDAEASRADSFYAQAEQDSARFYAAYTLDLIASFNCLGDTAAAHMMMILGAVAREQSDSARAESLYVRASAIYEAALGPASAELAESLNKRAILCYSQHRDAEAELLYKRALAIREQVFGSINADVAQSLTNLAILYRRESRWPEAAAARRRALDIRLAVFGPEHPETLSAMRALADILDYEAHYPDAARLLERVLALEEQSSAPDSLQIATTLNDLAIVYRHQGRNADAEPLYRRALQISEQALGPEDPDVALYLDNLANLCDDVGRSTEAESLYRRALAIRERALGSDHPDVATCLENMAGLYERRGMYAEAEALYRRALVINQKVLGPEHPDVALPLKNLGDVYREEGRYLEAEPLYVQAMEIRQKALGPEHPDVASSLNSLANLYEDEGRYADAEVLYRKALDINIRATGAESQSASINLYNLAFLFQSQDRFADADTLLHRVLDIEMKIRDVDSLSTAMNYSLLGEILQHEGHLDEAADVGRRAVELTRRTVGENHPEMAYQTCRLGWAYLRQHRLMAADSQFATAEALFGKVCGPNHPALAEVYRGRSFLAAARSDPAQAEYTARLAYEVSRSSLHDGAQALSERSALDYAAKASRETGRYLTALLQESTRSRANRPVIAKVVFSGKGQITDQIAQRYRAAEQDSDPHVAILLDSLRDVRFRLSSLRVSGSDNNHPQNYGGDIAAATATKERLEADLSRRSAAFRHEQACWDVDAATVAAAMPAKSALIEYMRYDDQPHWDTTRASYLAVVLRSSGELAVYPLGTAAAIDTAVAMYTRPFQNPEVMNEGDYPRLSANLSRLIWQPFAPILDGADLVFVAPDGALNLVAFAGLLDDDGHYLIERHALQLVSNCRDLLPNQPEARTGTGLLALGDPDFDGDRSATAVGTSAKSGGVVNAAMPYTRSGSNSQGLGSLRVKRLQATRKEVERVAEIWRRERNEPAAVYLGEDASEERFKKECTGKRVIHLATHAFFLNSAGGESRGDASVQSLAVNPLLQSGLLLARANFVTRGLSSEGADDGILTAEEVAGLNLNGVDLVVLSACETGLGEVRTGEGVYGLRRAFQMAGARTVISALWIVDDDASARLMSSLFEHADLDIAHAMQQACLDQLSYLRAAHRSDHPLHWAGFVATGDWRTP